MNQVARRIGRSLALVLPVALVLSGTLAVTRVPWTPSSPDSQLLTASATAPHAGRAAGPAHPRRPQDALLDRLLATLHKQDPGRALTELDRAVTRRPSLAKHCRALSARLGKAAVAAYGADRARSYARPVCDTSYLAGTRD